MRYFERLRAVEKCGKMDLRYSERRNCGTAELRCVRLCGTAVFGTAELRYSELRSCGTAICAIERDCGIRRCGIAMEDD